MSVEKVRAYLTPYGVTQRIRELEVSSATVELAAAALGGPPPASPRPSASRWESGPS